MPGDISASSTVQTAIRTRLTILHALALLLLPAAAAHAQNAAPDPFARGSWHVEADASAAFELWNYNRSHEDLFGLTQSVTYGVGDGFAVRGAQRFLYISQRAEDAVLLGLTIGVRRRVGHPGRVTGFLQGDLGISYTAIATPPRGTRFNYVAIGGGGVFIRTSPRVHVVSTMLLTHVSNAGLRGRSRNPDIEALGVTLGLNLRF
jgi:hypothetical protein